MYLFIYIYKDIYVYIYMHTYICVYIYIHIYIYTYTYVYIYTYTRIYISIYVYMNTFIPIYICIYTFIWVRKYAYTYIYIYIHVKTEYVCFDQTGDISTLKGGTLKLVDKFTYLGSYVSSNETDINTQLAKAWTANDRLLVIWKSDLTDKMKRSFFQAAIVSILLYDN